MAEKTSYKYDQIRALRVARANEAEDRKKAEIANQKKSVIPALREKMASIPAKRTKKEETTGKRK